MSFDPAGEYARASGATNQLALPAGWRRTDVGVLLLKFCTDSGLGSWNLLSAEQRNKLRVVWFLWKEALVESDEDVEEGGVKL